MNIDKAWSGPSRIRTLLKHAERDSDPVSMFHIGDRIDDVEVSVVVLKGRDVVRCFREWAERNRIFTPGKPVDDSEAKP